MGANSKRQPITSCHYFLPSIQRHKTLRNTFTGRGCGVIWGIGWALNPMAKGSSLSEERVSICPLWCWKGIFLCCISSRAATGSRGEAVSTVGHMGHLTQADTETETGNYPSSYFSLKNKHNPCQRWNHSSLTIYSQPAVLKWSRITDSREQCIWVLKLHLLQS